MDFGKCYFLIEFLFKARAGKIRIACKIGDEKIIFVHFQVTTKL